MKRIQRFLRAEDGPTVVEYAVLLALLVGMMVASITFVGKEFQAISEINMKALDATLTPDN